MLLYYSNFSTVNTCCKNPCSYIVKLCGKEMVQIHVQQLAYENPGYHERHIQIKMGGFAREEPLAVSGSSSQSHSGIAQEYQSTAVMQILDGLLWISKDSDNWPPCPLRLIRLVGFEYQLLTKRHIHAFTTDWYRWYRRTFYSMSSKAFSIEHITSCISSLSVCSSERLTHMRQTLS